MSPDIRVSDRGSVALVTPLTPAGRRWMAENVQAESWQWYGGGLAAEPRMVAAVMDGAAEDGLTVAME